MAASEIAIVGFGNLKYRLATDEVDGVHTLLTTLSAPNSAIALSVFGNETVQLATVEADGLHTLAVVLG